MKRTESRDNTGKVSPNVVEGQSDMGREQLIREATKFIGTGDAAAPPDAYAWYLGAIAKLLLADTFPINVTAEQDTWERPAWVESSRS